jgi:hypothetical protein
VVTRFEIGIYVVYRRGAWYLGVGVWQRVKVGSRGAERQDDGLQPRLNYHVLFNAYHISMISFF